MQHNAQRKDVSGGGHGLTPTLLGRRVQRRVHALALGVYRCAVTNVGIQQLGNAEVQQLDLAIVAHQQIGRLQVTVHHQVAVGMGHCGAHLQHQLQALGQVQVVSGCVIQQACPLHPLHHQVRPPGVIDACVIQPRDVWVFEQRADLPLMGHALGQPGMAGQPWQLERHLSVEDAVGAFGQPDRPHAASADLSHQAVRADPLTRLRLGRLISQRGQAWQAGQQQTTRRQAGQGQHLAQRGHQPLLLGRQPGQPRFLSIWRQFQCRIEQLAQRSDLGR